MVDGEDPFAHALMRATGGSGERYSLVKSRTRRFSASTSIPSEVNFPLPGIERRVLFSAGPIIYIGRTYMPSWNSLDAWNTSIAIAKDSTS